MYYFLLGLISGTPFGFSLGPVFFTIKETSLKRGFIAGVIVSLGILVSDLLYVVLISLGFAAAFSDDFSKSIFSFLGGAMLVAFGISFLIKRIDITTREDVEVSKKAFQSFMKGFLVNTLNPYVAIFWAATVAFAKVELNLTGLDVQFYLAGFLANLLIADILKAYLAQRLKGRLTSRLNLFYRIIGIIFLAFGAKLLFESFSIVW